MIRRKPRVRVGSDTHHPLFELRSLAALQAGASVPLHHSPRIVTKRLSVGC